MGGKLILPKNRTESERMGIINENQAIFTKNNIQSKAASEGVDFRRLSLDATVMPC